MKIKPIITVTGIDGCRISFHVDRLFGVSAPFKDEKSGETFDCVVVLRTIEPDRCTIFPVQEKEAELIAAWNEAARDY